MAGVARGVQKELHGRIDVFTYKSKVVCSRISIQKVCAQRKLRTCWESCVRGLNVQNNRHRSHCQ
jgi:hypothetical protein